MEVSGQLHAPATLPTGKDPPVLIGQEAGVEGKIPSAPPGIEPRSSYSHNVIQTWGNVKSWSVLLRKWSRPI